MERARRGTDAKPSQAPPEAALAQARSCPEVAMRQRSRAVVHTALLAVALLGACGGHVPPTLHPPAAPPARSDESRFLKVHMRSGELYLLGSWQVDGARTRIDGEGTRYTAAREARETGRQSIPVADVALLEVDRPESIASGGLGALAFMTTLFGTLTAVCAADPKGCFGSCPTFYADDHATGRPLAEGFSSSIARSLEARDVDALFAFAPRGGRRLELTMRNEAFETHAVRRVRLLAFPRPSGGRVLRSPDGAFHEAFELRAARSCRAAEGDCGPALAAWDGEERSSPADASDLATREEIELEFAPAGPGSLGLVVGARQTLLSTFLFYQTIAHFGRGAGAFLAAVERGGGAERGALAMARVLGGVEALVAGEDGRYGPLGTFDEAGPIAGDVVVLPFAASGRGPVRVRLRLARGHWRLDYVALARLGGSPAPRVVEPSAVLRNGRADEPARTTWRAGTDHVVTIPGDALRVRFELERPARQLELFLESEGFYYEWLRSEWLRDEDAELALLSITRPEEALRRLAGPFKQREAGLDRTFWASRFRR
jgi:hypothetical protein